MQNYKKLQQLYRNTEIKDHCVDIDFGYAFICAMASSEFELENWMPLLFCEGKDHFSDEKVASDFAQVVLAIYQQANIDFLENKPLQLMVEISLVESNDAVTSYANGYLQALLMINNMQMHQFIEESPEANLQQTCLLLLDKLATVETQDAQKIALFNQLPDNNEIVALLPELLGSFGHLCLLVKTDG